MCHGRNGPWVHGRGVRNTEDELEKQRVSYGIRCFFVLTEYFERKEKKKLHILFPG